MLELKKEMKMSDISLLWRVYSEIQEPKAPYDRVIVETKRFGSTYLEPTIRERNQGWVWSAISPESFDEFLEYLTKAGVIILQG